MNKLEYLWKWFLARFHLNNEVVCEMSKGKQLNNDYHDYSDDIIGVPIHFHVFKCKRCGKEFTI